jgi:hypothetical protein
MLARASMRSLRDAKSNSGSAPGIEFDAQLSLT